MACNLSHYNLIIYNHSLKNMSDSEKMLAKAALRKELNSILKTLSKEEISKQSEIVTNKVGFYMFSKLCN